MRVDSPRMKRMDELGTAKAVQKAEELSLWQSAQWQMKVFRMEEADVSWDCLSVNGYFGA